MPTFRIRHTTRYQYSNPAVDGVNQIMLYPIQDGLQSVQRHELSVTGKPAIEEFYDYFGNKVGMFSLVKPHDQLLIDSAVDVMTKPISLPYEIMSPVSQWQHLMVTNRNPPYLDFLQVGRFASKDEMSKVVSSIASKSINPLEIAQKFVEFVFSSFTYTKGVTTVETAIDEIWNLKAGVCQDFAHILIVLLRMSEIPARYVSGYICPKNHELRGEGATHAWAEVYIPYYGWLGIDPTNNCIVSDRHIRLAVGRDFSDCTPVKGTYKGSSEHTLEVSVRIDNGTLPPPGINPSSPIFTYTVKKGEPATNSYRKFVEMQQQQ